jgi:prevent-host-death family protein
MTVVSITELKAHFSEYLRRTQAGERFHVTSRNAEVAELGPPDPVRAALWRMVAAGEAEWSGEDMVLPDALPVNPGRPLSELISEDRGPYLPGTDPEPP